jgi:hypothetical protein
MNALTGSRGEVETRLSAKQLCTSSILVVASLGLDFRAFHGLEWRFIPPFAGFFVPPSGDSDLPEYAKN